ncbi:MAG TPA: signal peptidase I [Thermoanaerobaculia bacterium]|nr:signal peptidase I [Thermoanaerobaculia bacterium]
MKTLRLIAQPILIALAMGVCVRHAVHIYSIPSGSMEPTLQIGDHILVTPYRSLPQRGDVIVFHSPIRPDELLVKRITGVPGDLVEAQQGRLIVPAGCYFVLGDNRANSYDSRQWGVLSRNQIVGRARLVIWSSGSATEPRANAASSARPTLPAVPSHIDRIFKLIH